MTQDAKRKIMTASLDVFVCVCLCFCLGTFRATNAWAAVYQLQIMSVTNQVALPRTCYLEGASLQTAVDGAVGAVTPTRARKRAGRGGEKGIPPVDADAYQINRCLSESYIASVHPV